MKNLKEYITEGIFDTDEDTIDKSIKDQIKQFLKDNFDGSSSCKISDKPNANGKFEVSSKGDVITENEKITSLTNGMFIWVKVSGCFSCAFCKSLTSLEGAPKEVGGCFGCVYCSSLTSLKGAPEKVSGDFECNGCNSLTSLEGSPKKVGGDFRCRICESLTSLKGAPKKVGGDFNCEYCGSLKSLEGAPKEVGGDFECGNCKIDFTKEDIKKVSNIKGNIYN